MSSINTSGHKYGLVYPGVGWVVWRDVPALPEELIYRVNYLGDEMATFALNFSRPGAQVVAQYYQGSRADASSVSRRSTPHGSGATLSIAVHGAFGLSTTP